MRVHLVDPSAYTPPYDDALARALARAGAQVELFTSRFTYAPVPVPDGYSRYEHFYRLADRSARASANTGSGPRSRATRALKLAEHVPEMLSYRRLARSADIVHFQWLPVQPLDLHLLPAPRSPAAGAANATVAARPRLVITAHDILPREPLAGQREAQRRLYGHFDAVVAHSEQGRARLTAELGVEQSRVHVIPHGALLPGQAQPPAAAGENARAPAVTRPPKLPAGFREAEGPVALFFGLLRPYKGLDVLLEAWRGARLQDAELWIVGMPRMELKALEQRATRGVRLLPRFVSDAELSAFLDRASLVVLPYREIDASGAAMTAIGAAVPLLLSDAGGFPELAASGAARVVPAGDARALAQALRSLLSDAPTLRAMAGCAREAAAGAYGWDNVAAKTLALYEALLSENHAP
jgi:glycosyltransferase involved in cell wall biosynthesis